MNRLAATVLVALGGLATTRAARADLTKDQCIDANTKGQELRRAGRLSAARQQLQSCATAACPGLVRNDCARRLDELEKVQPTIVFSVKDGGGKDVSAVKVSVDGRVLVETIDGTELQVDPGQHSFTFSVPGQPAVEKAIVLAEGDKARREEILVGGGEPAPAPPRTNAHLVIATDDRAAIALDGKVVAAGRLDASETSGPHALSITEPGMRPYSAEIDLREGETRTLQVSLEAEHHAPAWPWIVGGAAAAVGVGVGAYFLFKPADTVTPVPIGNFASATLASWRP
jgi:hypothetical protein